MYMKAHSVPMGFFCTSVSPKVVIDQAINCNTMPKEKN